LIMSFFIVNRYNTFMNKKRILFFLPFMHGGGAERVILTLLRHLSREKYELILVLMKKEGRYLSQIPYDITVVDLQVSQVRYAIFKIVSIIRTQKPDIVFSTLAYLNLIIAIIRPFFSKNISFIARESNTVSVSNKREKYPKLFDWLYKNVYKNFDHIVTQAAFMRNDLQENYGIASSKMSIIYNPIDSANIEKLSYHDKDLYPQKYNLLAVGRLNYQKGFDMLLSIMTRLDETYHLTIIGEGEDGDVLQKQIKTLGLEDKVHLGGFCENPYAYMKQADLLVLSSRFEGLPNVVLEAASCGTPVVAFDSDGGTSEIVHHGHNGFLVDCYDEEAFARSIQKARSYKFDIETIEKETKEQFTITKVIKEYEEIFDNQTDGKS